jgi:hypothetical protein
MPLGIVRSSSRNAARAECAGFCVWTNRHRPRYMRMLRSAGNHIFQGKQTRRCGREAEGGGLLNRNCAFAETPAKPR